MLEVSLAAFFAVTAVWFTAVWSLRRQGEFHHYYVGLASFLLGHGAPFWAPWAPGWPFVVVGLVLMADDAWQHAMQASGWPLYLSPLHRFYARHLWDRFPCVRRFIRWLDGRF